MFWRRFLLFIHTARAQFPEKEMAWYRSQAIWRLPRDLVFWTEAGLESRLCSF